MVSHALEILRQGLWASLTGGWFYNPRQSIFGNTLQLYLWLFLLLLPFILYLTSPLSVVVWTCYTLLLTTVLVSIKVVNHRLHHMFDTSEVIEEQPDSTDLKSDRCSSGKTSPLHGETLEGIELMELGQLSVPPGSGHTPPVQCSCRSSVIDRNTARKRNIIVTPADSMEYINKLIAKRGSGSDLKVDVHRKDSLGPYDIVTIHTRSADTALSSDHDKSRDDAPNKIVYSTPNLNQSPDIPSSIERPSASHGAAVKDSHQGDGISLSSKLDFDVLSKSTDKLLCKVPHTDDEEGVRKDKEELPELESPVTPDKIVSSKFRNRRQRRVIKRTRSSADDGTGQRRGSLDHARDAAKPVGRKLSLPSELGMTHDEAMTQHFCAMRKESISEESSKTRLSFIRDAENVGKDLDDNVFVDADKCKEEKASDDEKLKSDTACCKEDLPRQYRGKKHSGDGVEPKVPKSVTLADAPFAKSRALDHGSGSIKRGRSMRLRNSRRGRRKLIRSATDASRCSSDPEWNPDFLTRSTPGNFLNKPDKDTRPSFTSAVSEPVDTSTIPDPFQAESLKNNHEACRAWKLDTLPTTSYSCADLGTGEALTERGDSVDCVASASGGNDDCAACVSASAPAVNTRSAPTSAPTVGSISAPSVSSAGAAATSADGADMPDAPDGQLMKILLLERDDEGVTSSHHSSVIALDELLLCDTDSSSVSPRSRSPSYDDSSSTLTNDEAVDHDRDDVINRPTIKFAERPAHAQGAIPKRRSHKANKASKAKVEKRRRKVSNTSGEHSDFSDNGDLSRRLLEILRKSDSAECEIELKKLKEELDLRRRRKREAHEAETKEPDDGRCSAASSCSNPSEMSSLLPLTAVSPSTSGTYWRERRRRRQQQSNRSLSSRDSGSRDKTQTTATSAAAAAAETAAKSLIHGASSRHIAQTHDDTTEGAVHCFQDEFGNWLTYTFEENSSGVALGIIDKPIAHDKLTDFFGEDKWETCSSSSGSAVVLDGAVKQSVASSSGQAGAQPGSLDLSLPGAESGRLPLALQTPLQSYLESIMEMSRTQAQDAFSHDTETTVSHSVANIEQKAKHYYNFSPLPFWMKQIKIRFDRLALLALLDRHPSLMENAISIILAVAVGLMGILLLSYNFFHDFWIFVFCFVMASCQYSLIKSVQPDAASPMHGYNHIISFSRPVYFCVCTAMILLLEYGLQTYKPVQLHLYTLAFTSRACLTFTRDLIIVFVLCFPLIFTVGLLPQINTFSIYLLEQIDIHVFGGAATTSLVAATCAVSRSIIGVAVLYGFCYLGIRNGDSQHVLFSIFAGLLVSVSYHLSRSASDPTVLSQLIVRLFRRVKCMWTKETRPVEDTEELNDPLPEKLRKAVYDRLRGDLIVCCMVTVLAFAVHVSTLFSTPALQPTLSDVLYYFAGSVGLLIHYVIPQLRKEMPWLCCSHPLLKTQQHDEYATEFQEPAATTWFEKMYTWLRFFERNVVYPAVSLCALTVSAPSIVKKFDVLPGCIVIVICGMKMLRTSFTDTPHQHITIIFTVFFFKYDFHTVSETLLIDYFFMAILMSKLYDCILKLQFIITYIAPWQITWGSAFHAVAQPFSVPHSAMLFVQTLISSVLSTPLNPFLGSAIFITSYVRPIKFWEKDYNTKRVDHTNTRLSSQLDRNPGTDDNNLNSIFYEHLTRSLQHSLCGDLMMGRWGHVSQGDCFIMASDKLNALVHIIEMANGLVTFQLRGLEFRGTYCQQREVEAITIEVDEDDGLCCCEPGHLPHFLSLNAGFNQRWLAWEVLATDYILEGYSISDNSAASMLQVFDLRKVLITYYVKSIIYYTIRSPKLEQWLENETVIEALKPYQERTYADVDPTFSMHVDDDYDLRLSGVSRNSYCTVYYDWIQYCASRREMSVDHSRESVLVSLCFGLSLLGRRALSTAAHNNSSASVDFFLFGLHALFKGDFRITSERDEWVFSDMEMLRRVVAPGVRMSLKLHQDHFACPYEYDNHEFLYNAISTYEESMVISHEADPAWRNAVLSNTQSLLALRHVFDEGSDEYKIIMLNKRFLVFRIIKVNRECVRGLWAGQQQELVFLRNRNPERGSIQNAKQALRNMINSSCDQPIGYPIYVSPLTTSYSGTNAQLSSVLGHEFSLKGVKNALRNAWTRMRARCGASCTSSGSVIVDDPCCVNADMAANCPPAANATPSICRSHRVYGEREPPPLGANRGSLHSSSSSASKPTAFVSIAGLLGEQASRDPGQIIAAAARAQTLQSAHSGHGLNTAVSGHTLNSAASGHTLNTAVSGHGLNVTLGGQQDQLGKQQHEMAQRVKIIDPSQIYDNINLGRRIDVLWPNDEWRTKGGKSSWGGWVPEKGMEGTVVHKWIPCHREQGKRSHVDRTILLVRLSNERYVPIAESGVADLGAEV